MLEQLLRVEHGGLQFLLEWSLVLLQVLGLEHVGDKGRGIGWERDDDSSVSIGQSGVHGAYSGAEVRNGGVEGADCAGAGAVIVAFVVHDAGRTDIVLDLGVLLLHAPPQSGVEDGGHKDDDRAGQDGSEGCHQDGPLLLDLEVLDLRVLQGKVDEHLVDGLRNILVLLILLHVLHGVEQVLQDSREQQLLYRGSG